MCKMLEKGALEWSGVRVGAKATIAAAPDAQCNRVVKVPCSSHARQDGPRDRHAFLSQWIVLRVLETVQEGPDRT